MICDAVFVGTFLIAFWVSVLVLLDRDEDLSVMLHHPWTYQALIHDVLGIAMNRTTVPAATPTEKPALYDIDYSDVFWQQNALMPYPNVAETIDRQLKQYMQTKESLIRPDAAAGTGDDTRQLLQAVEALPELSSRKNEIDKHMAIASAIMQQVKDRQLHVLFAMEEKMLTKGTADRGEVLRVVKEISATPQDKLRLYLIWYLCWYVIIVVFPSANTDGQCSGASDSEIEKELQSLGADLSALQVVKQYGPRTSLLLSSF